MRTIKQEYTDSGEFHLSMSQDGQQIEFKAKDVEVAGDATDIESIGPHGYLFIAEERRGLQRTLRIEPNSDGQLKRSYSIQGMERTFDAEARDWLARNLLDFVRQSGVGAEARVRWLLRHRGPVGVLDEISQIKNNPLKSIYFSTLVRTGDLDSATLVKAVGQARREITSPTALADFLTGLVEHAGKNSDLCQAFFKASESINAANERRRVLSSALRAEPPVQEMLRSAIQSSATLNSEHEVADFLIEVTRVHRINEDLRPAFLAVMTQMRSRHYQQQVVNALALNEAPH